MNDRGKYGVIVFCTMWFSIAYDLCEIYSFKKTEIWYWTFLNWILSLMPHQLIKTALFEYIEKSPETKKQT